ncbi:MAG: class I SAM-dependent methyltransferase [Brachybacterium sp.]|nr:class I SAM-dependent methyltransferase [Brachybacterium sp.]
MTVDDATLATWREALQEKPAGWDFSELTGYREEHLPWDYTTFAHNLAQVSHHVLDLGTGGGELLSSLHDVLPEDTVATEGWAPNVPVARTALEPLGIEVVEYDSEAPGSNLPFAPERFDLVLARHESFDAEEVYRVLSKGGAFLSQQVAGDDLRELYEIFDLEPGYTEVTLENIERELTSAGFRVERADTFRGRAEFDDVTTLLRFLRRAPWYAPEDLDVDTHREVLEALHARTGDGPLVMTTSRFWLLARTPQENPPAVTDFSQLLDDKPEVPDV